jgi:putative tryptophan/tyrosine transport system substrate-binding protein
MPIDRLSKRRGLLAVFAFAALRPAAPWARDAKVWRIGFVGGSPPVPSLDASLYGGFLQGMRELGYAEGRDFVMEWRFAEGRLERFPELVRDLVRRRVDILVVVSAAILAAKQTTSAIPIVMGYSTDPVTNGYVASLSHPGGNVTGLSGNIDAYVKQFDLLKAVVPKLSRVGVLVHPRNPDHAPVLVAIRAAGNKSGVDVIEAAVASPDDIATALARLRKEGADGLISTADGFFFQNVRLIAELTLKHRLPWIAPQSEYADAGALISYGDPVREFFRRAAGFVDKIIKGAKPGQIPIEQPNVYDLVINLRTAKALGIPVSSSLKVRANRIID